MSHWIRKFYFAFRGIALGIRGQSSFAVHLPMAVGVVLLACLLQCELWQWIALLICIGCVLASELANSAIEELASALCREHNEQVGRALDIASAAVLIMSITAAIVGLVIFTSRLLAIFQS